MKISYKIIFSIITSLALLASCGNAKNNTEKDDLDDLLDKHIEEKKQIVDKAVQDILHSIPSPVELASFVQSSGSAYTNELLNDLDRADSYTTDFQKGLGLGAYGADLGYVNLYQKTGTSLEYLNGIRGVADELKIGQFFDYATIKRLADNSHSIDSVLSISTEGFEKMSNYLKEKKRSHISMAILVGGWLESLYIATYVAGQSDKNNEGLVEKIGEQKIILGDINLLLELYKDDPYVAQLTKDMRQLKGLYEKVSITYEYSEPVTKEVDGMLVIESNTTSIVNISDDLLKKITKEVKSLRQKIY